MSDRTSDQRFPPVRKSWSLEELQAVAQRFMVREYGKPIEMDDPEERRAWHERLGFLIHFSNELWADRL